MLPDTPLRRFIFYFPALVSHGFHVLPSILVPSTLFYMIYTVAHHKKQIWCIGLLLRHEENRHKIFHLDAFNEAFAKQKHATDF